MAAGERRRTSPSRTRRSTVLTLPAENVVATSFTYDPNSPTPQVGGPLLEPSGGPVDNAELERRTDVVTFDMPPLTEDASYIGTPTVELWVTSDVPAPQLFVRLNLVDSTGRSTNITDTIVTARADRDAPGRVAVTLPPTCLRVRAGERFRLVVAGGAFPRFARSPGTGESPATATTFHVARIAVHHDTEHPSRSRAPASRKRHSFHRRRRAGPCRRSGLTESDGIWRCLDGGTACTAAVRGAQCHDAPSTARSGSPRAHRRGVAETRLPRWASRTRRANSHSCRRRSPTTSPPTTVQTSTEPTTTVPPTTVPTTTTALPEPTMYRPAPIRSGTLVTASVMPVTGVLDGSTVTFQIVEMPDGRFLGGRRRQRGRCRRGPSSGRSAINGSTRG